MKKTLIGVLAAAVILSVGAASADAAGPGAGRNFTDRDGDGVCDLAGGICRFVDEDQDGRCDSCGLCREDCCFTDADGDGICGQRMGLGRGRGGGFRGGRGR